jgi:hypothetical protein
VCPDNQPRNFSNYEKTFPIFLCQQWIANCVANHPDDLDGTEACRSVTCGTENPDDVDSATSASATQSATPTTRGSGAAETGSQTATATPSATDSAAMNLAQDYGTSIFVSMLLALFGLAM